MTYAARLFGLPTFSDEALYMGRNTGNGYTTVHNTDKYTVRLFNFTPGNITAGATKRLLCVPFSTECVEHFANSQIYVPNFRFEVFCWSWIVEWSRQ